MTSFTYCRRVWLAFPRSEKVQELGIIAFKFTTQSEGDSMHATFEQTNTKVERPERNSLPVVYMKDVIKILRDELCLLRNEKFLYPLCELSYSNAQEVSFQP